MPSDRFAPSQAPEAGQPFDPAPFGRVRWWTGTEQRDLHAHDLSAGDDGLWRPARDAATGEWHIGLEWPEPRDVRRVTVRFAGAVPPGLQVQYWQKNWPTPAPERLPGARRGWIGRDDPWHGRWISARGAASVEGSACTVAFDPIDLAELRDSGAVERLDEAEHYLARFRRTLKLRIVCGGASQPALSGIAVYSGAAWRAAAVDVRFDPEVCRGDWSGTAEVANGYVLGCEGLDLGQDEAAGVQAAGVAGWQCRVEGHVTGVRLRLLVTDAGADSADRTIVTVRTAARSFSFLMPDLEQEPIYIRDYGVLVTQAGAAADFSTVKAALAAAPRPIYDRVPAEPEQSLARALAEIPPLDVTKQAPFGRYLPIGVEAGRQEWAVRYNGELFADKSALKLMGRDAARLLWPGHMLRFRCGTGDPPDFRERRDATQQSLLDGWLPVVISRWLDREIEYEQTAFATLLDGPLTGPDERRGDENVAALLRFRIRNATPGRKRARLWIAIAPPEQVELRDELVVALGRVVPAEPVARQWRVAPYDRPGLRLALHTGGRGCLTTLPCVDEPGGPAAVANAVVYDVDLDAFESHTITLAAPFVTLTEPAEWERAAAAGFDARLAEVVAYWRDYIEAGGQMDVPDAALRDFHRAVRTHVAISVDKDPVSGLIAVPAATWAYGVCANEACWQISMLDQAGHHDRARRYLETFLATQGLSHMDGDFVSSEGVMQGLDFDAGVPHRSGFAYNLDPGFIMETLARHYRLTGDREWLAQSAPRLVAAADFVLREREATKRTDVDGRPVPEWGLLPAGHLEDNPEWRYWFAVNGHAYRGVQQLALALAEIGHPEADRLSRGAAAYREDIRAAARRAMVEAPVVRLLDGAYIPRIPTRAGLRGREWGWFREAAYGALHLLEGDVFEPDSEEMTWVLKDLEDNLFVSREWGRPVDVERRWFSQGGVTIQANLQDLAIDYLRRGQVKHALRALFNNFGASLYPDVRAFTEHPVIELGHGVGPFYKTPDESKALTWLRALLLLEDGDCLHLAPGAPEAWYAAGQSFGVRRMASAFGPVSYRVESGAGRTRVRVELDPGRGPRALTLRVRPPAGQPAWDHVTVNGRPHAGFDPAAGIVQVAAPAGTLDIVVE